MSDIIKVNYLKLFGARLKLIKLGNTLHYRKCRIDISESKGPVADELVKISDSLNDIHRDLNVLVNETSKYVNEIVFEFMKADANIADIYEKK